MGQEIVYCFKCSNRIIGADIDKVAGVQIGNRTCCAQCLPAVMAELPESQRETLLAGLSRSGSSKTPTRTTPRGGTEISSTKTPRAGSPAPPSEASKPPIVPIAIGAGALVLAVILFLAFRKDTTPAAGQREPPPSDPKPTPSTATLERARAAIQKARDAVGAGIDIDLQVRLWEEAIAKSAPTTCRDEAAQGHGAILVRRKEVYAQELARLMDSVDGVIRQDEYKKALDALASARKRHELPEWPQAIDRRIEDIKKLEAGNVPFRQGADVDNLVCFEAEHFNVKTDVGDHAWTLVTAPAGYVGSGAMAALPNTGAGYVTNFATSSPRMDFRIQFAKAGKYYIWVRGYAESTNDDSVHAGLDGKEVKSSTAIGLTANKKWNWCNRIMANAAGSIDVPTPGIHTVNLWMREDGAVIDRLLITTNAKYVPKEAGPAESPR